MQENRITSKFIEFGKEQLIQRTKEQIIDSVLKDELKKSPENQIKTNEMKKMDEMRKKNERIEKIMENLSKNYESPLKTKRFCEECSQKIKKSPGNLTSEE